MMLLVHDHCQTRHDIVCTDLYRKFNSSVSHINFMPIVHFHQLTSLRFKLYEAAEPGILKDIHILHWVHIQCKALLQAIMVLIFLGH